jgi:hypothetical protein
MLLRLKVDGPADRVLVFFVSFVLSVLFVVKEV